MHPFLRLCTQGGTLKKLVMQQMSQPHKDIYSNTQALRWCLNMAEALEYLHTRQPIVSEAY